MEKRRKEYCIECRKEIEYTVEKKKIQKVIRDKKYEFEISVALCTECGEEMSLPEFLDLNINEIDEQYRNAESIVSIEDIERLMKIYNIGKAPLSLALGFGEVTITRYLAGQIPSKEYSDIIKKALSSPKFMKELLLNNKEKIADTAYKKVLIEIEEIDKLFNISSKLAMIISYIFEKLEEVTPLTLQKLLYYVQGINLAINNVSMFDEDCEAWIHGPVYAKVYALFKNFRYNPIDDDRFAMFKGKFIELNFEEKKIIDLVIDTFGIYSGKILEKITHNEEPWVNARGGYTDTMPSNKIIEKAEIQKYFSKIHEQYVISNKEGLKEYIRTMLSLNE